RPWRISAAGATAFMPERPNSQRPRAYRERSMKKVNHQVVASWVFGSVFVIFILGVFLFGPPELPSYKQQMLAYISALLAGLFGLFFAGSLLLHAHLWLPGKWVVQGSTGFALFLIVLFWWNTSAAPVRVAPLPLSGQELFNPSDFGLEKN